MRLYRPPITSRLLYPGALFRLSTVEKKLLLTFDDGPDPASTSTLAEILENHNVKALFFCLGRRAKSYPELVDLLRSRNHVIGNHGYEHLNGFKTSLTKFIENTRKASGFTSSELFRPPYGIMKISQYRWLKKEFRIVLWDLMVYDFDTRLAADDCMNILKHKIRPGSVIVLHDTAVSSTL